MKINNDEFQAYAEIKDSLEVTGNAMLSLASVITANGLALSKEDRELVRIAVLPTVVSLQNDIKLTFLMGEDPINSPTFNRLIALLNFVR